MDISNAAGSGLAADLQGQAAQLVGEARVLGGADAAAGALALPGQALPAGFSFSQSMKDALASVNQDDQLAARKMDDVDSGKSDDLVGAMLASQQANLSFSMLMQVRNKVMGAVDDLLKLPV
jgi:flagellar hook-basal body complex protein FliE